MKNRAACTATPRNGRSSGCKAAALLAVCASLLAAEARANVASIAYQDSDDWLAAPAYIQSPVLDAGIGEIGFRYRVLDPASQTPGKLTLWVADSPEAGENEWRQITVDDLDRPELPAASAPYAEWASYAARYDAFEEQAEMLGSLANITNGDYQYFTVEICDLTNHVLRICSDTNGTQCVDIDGVIVTAPVQTSIDILDVQVFSAVSGTPIPLGDENVGFEVRLGNPRRSPTDIRVFADYYIGTNVWGVANWSAAPFGSIELVQDPENEYLYRSYSGDMILGLPVDSVVQYRIRVTFDGAFSAPVLGTSFENPSWYEPVDLNAMYGTTGASDITPYYFVFSCPTGVVRINEFYPSYGTAYNQREFVELIGPANLSLEGWKLDIVEGGDSAFEDCVTSTYTMPAGTRLSGGGTTAGWGFLVIGDDGGDVVDKVDLVWPDSEAANLPPTTTDRGGGLRLCRSMGAYVDRVSYGGGNNGNPANAMADRGYTFAGTRPNYAACCYSLETQSGEEGDEWIWNCRKVGATVGEMNPTYTAPNPNGQYTDAVDGIEWTYVISNGVATVGSGSISGARAVPTATEGAISIPSMLGGCPVTGIGDYAFANCTNLTSLRMSSSVASIGDYAFSECPGLVSITISESLTSIGRYAFNECSGLPSVSIPPSVTRIGYEAFSGCRDLAEVHISDLAAWCGISFGSFYYSNPLYTAQHLFLNGEEVVDLVIPDGVTNITYVAFVGGRNFQSVTIPSSVTSIGYSAFSCCTGLTAVHIHDLASWCKISFGANYDSNPLYHAGHLFLNGNEATNLTIPSGTTRIGNYAFCGCDGLASIAIPDCVTSIGHAAFFGCTGLTAITIPDSVTEIGDDAFANCTSLENVFVDAGNPVYSDLNGVLFSDDGAVIVVFPAGRSGRYGIPDGVETIADSAFRGCTGLTFIAIPDSVNEIGSYAFYGCTGLTSITIPDSVAGIGFNAFSGCRGLTTITIPEALSPRASYWGVPSRCEILIAENVRTLHVDATAGDDVNDGLSWATAKASIQAAIDIATAGDTIYVGPGEYVVCEDGDLISSALRIVATDGPGATCLRGCVFYDNASAGNGTPPFSLEGFTAENAYFWGVSMSNCVLTADGEPGSASGAEDCFLANCVVTGNRCEYNGIFYNCSLLRCTVAGNVVAGETALASGYGGEVQDSIVWGNVNESGEQANWANASQVPFFEHSCTWPLPRNGEGNIDADPMLVDAANGDLRIRVGSPCIENGVQTMGAVLGDPVEPTGQLPDGNYTETVDGIEWTYTVSNGEASVGRGAVPTSTTGAITIPSTLGGCPVTCIGVNAFSGLAGLTAIEIPASVTNIGTVAFARCSVLEVVVIHGDEMTFGAGPFLQCSALQCIVMKEDLLDAVDHRLFDNLPSGCEVVDWRYYSALDICEICEDIGASGTGVRYQPGEEIHLRLVVGAALDETTISGPLTCSFRVADTADASAVRTAHFIGGIAGGHGHSLFFSYVVQEEDDIVSGSLFPPQDGRYFGGPAAQRLCRDQDGYPIAPLLYACASTTGGRFETLEISPTPAVGFALEAERTCRTGDAVRLLVTFTGNGEPGWEDEWLPDPSTGDRSLLLNFRLGDSNGESAWRTAAFSEVMERDDDFVVLAFTYTVQNRDCLVDGALHPPTGLLFGWNMTGIRNRQGVPMRFATKEFTFNPAGPFATANTGETAVSINPELVDAFSVCFLDADGIPVDPGVPAVFHEGQTGVRYVVDVGYIHEDPVPVSMDWGVANIFGESRTTNVVLAGVAVVTNTLPGIGYTGADAGHGYAVAATRDDRPDLSASMLARVTRLVTPWASAEWVDGIEWVFTVADGNATVGAGTFDGERAVPPSTAGAVAIPATLGGAIVTGIGEYAFEGCTGLTSITIPGTVTNIAASAFDNCSGLTAFSVDGNNPNYSSTNGLLLSQNGTTVLRGINGVVAIPDGVTSINSGAFSDCPALTSLAVPEIIFHSNDWRLEHLHDFLREWGLADGCAIRIGDVSIESEMTDNVRWYFSIRDGKATVADVEGDGWSWDVVIPDTLGGGPVIGIGPSAFFNPDFTISSITIPDSVTSIGERAFEQCSMVSITIPDCATNIAESAFEATHMYEIRIRILDQASWVSGAFNRAFKAAYEVANGGGVIPRKLIVDGEEVTTFVIPDGVTNIGEDAFLGCSGLTSVTIPGSVTSIGDSAFFGCAYFGAPGLASIVIPDSVTNIGARAFSYSGLKWIVIPDALADQAASWELPDGCEIVLRSSLTGLTTADCVPHEWFYHYGAFLDAADGDCDDAAQLPAANGVNKVWECYVAGLDPTGETATFTATIEMVDGKPHVTYNPPLSAAEAAKREYRTLGKRTLDADEDWTDVTDVTDLDAAGYQFFKVKVRMKE